jgi:hypothetical protein
VTIYSCSTIALYRLRTGKYYRPFSDWNGRAVTEALDKLCIGISGVETSDLKA